MSKILLTIILCLSTQITYGQNTKSLSPGQTSPPASLDNIEWITGHWKGTAFGGLFEEIWSPPMGESMMGAYKQVNDGKVIFYELISIVEKEGSLTYLLKHFNADLTGWEEKNEVMEFKLVDIEKDAVYFDGLTFIRKTDDLLNVYVRIEDNKGNPEEAEFIFQRVEP